MRTDVTSLTSQLLVVVVQLLPPYICEEQTRVALFLPKIRSNRPGAIIRLMGTWIGPPVVYKAS